MNNTDEFPLSTRQRLSGECFRLLHGVTSPVVVLDRNGYIVWFNDAHQELCGFTLDELKGTLLWERLVADECAAQARRNYIAIPTRHCLLVMRKKNGKCFRRRWHNRWVPDAEGESIHIVMTGTEHNALEEERPENGRRYVEEALQNSEIRLRTLFNAAPEFIFVIDRDGVILQLNRYVTEQSGYSEAELTGHNIREFFSEASRLVCECNFPGLRECGYNRADIEFICKDRRVLKMDCLATGIPDKDGEYVSFLIIQRDVTAQTHAAAALADSERRFRTLFNSSLQLIGLLDPDGILLQVNQTALDMCDPVCRELVGGPFWETAWWNGVPGAQQRLRDAIGQAVAGELVRYETGMAGKRGASLIVDFSLKPVIDEHGETQLIIWEARDITQRRRAEENARRHQRELAHVARLSTMGEMASGMAHELNQPLAAMVSYCGSAQSLVTGLATVPAEVAEMLRCASEQAIRAGDIIRHLREFVSKGSTNRQPMDLDPLIREIIDFLGCELRNSNLQVELRLNSQGRRARVDKVQIEQVMVNLVRNSLEALQSAGVNDGCLVIQTRVLPEKRISITVRDNGPGIDTAMASRIFEPFQTSKASGMGMGLSISRSIVNAHGGKLWLDESYRNGACFGFELDTCD